MKRTQALLLIVAALGLSTLGEVFPKAWVGLQDPENIRFIGSLAQYAQPCSESFKNAECRIEYAIPTSELRDSSGRWFRTFGLGFFLTDYAVKCDDTMVSSPSREFAPTLVLDAYKVYKTIDLDTLNCGESKVLILYSLNSKSFPTHGQISANALVGGKDYVSALKRTIEFFNAGMYLAFALALLIAVLSTRLVLSPFLEEKRGAAGLGIHAQMWMLFAAFKSGIFEIFFLTPDSALLLFRVQTFVSLYAHCSVLILAPWKGSRDSRWSRLAFQSTLWGYAVFAGTPMFNKYLGVMLAISVAARFVSFTVTGVQDWRIAAFALAAAGEMLKMFGAKWLPSGSMTLALVVTLQMTEFFGLIRFSGVLAAVNLWSRKLTARSGKDHGVQEVLETFCENVTVSRASFFRLLSNGDYVTFTYDANSHSQKFVEKNLNTVPGVLGHVIATGEPLLHEDALNTFSRNLFQRAPIESFGKFFTVMPVRSAKGLIGVAAITGYSFDPFRESEMRSRLDAYLPALCEALAVSSERRIAELADNSFDRIARILAQVSADTRGHPLDEYAQRLVDSLEREFGWSCFVAVYNREHGTMDVISHSFKEGAGKKELTSVIWVMKRENVRGPAPLAIFQARRVMAANVEWIRELVSHNTQAMFGAADTKSLCVLPIRRGTQTQDGASFGLIWLSASRAGTFDSTFERTAMLLQESLESEIHRHVHAAIERAVLNDQVRPDIHERIMRGEVPIEQGIGTFVQVDLARSTKISQSLGPEVWKEYQRNFVRQIRNIGAEYGLTAEMFIWDAVYLTSPGPIEPDALLGFTQRALAIAGDIAYQYGKRDLLDGMVFPGRVCATYGDITKSVVKGAWTVNEHLLAALSKIEQAAKSSSCPLTVARDLARCWNTHPFSETMIGAEQVYVWDGRILAKEKTAA